MERIVSIHAMYTVLTRLVTESMVVVCLVVKKMKTVVRIYPTNFLNFYRKCILCTFEKSKLSIKAVVLNSMNYLYEDLKLFSFLFFSYYKKYKITTVSIGQFACNCRRDSWRIRDCSYRNYFCHVCCTV